MAEGVERFRWTPSGLIPIAEGVEPRDGDLVLYSGYEKLGHEVEGLRRANDNRKANAAALRRQRDQGRQEVLEEMAAEFEQRAEGKLEQRDAISPHHRCARERHEAVAQAHRSDASLAREKAATLDPSGGDCERCKGSGRGAPDNSVDGPVGTDCPCCNGTGKMPASPPSGEQGEEDWPGEITLGRLQAPGDRASGPHILLDGTEPPTQNWQTCRYVPAADTSKEEQSGVELIAAERARQVSEEGWTPDHDDRHDSGEMVWAAECYLNPGAHVSTAKSAAPEGWPWERDAWKPVCSSGGPESMGKITTADTIRNLTKAGALIAAEIDRLLRASSKEVGGDGE